MKEQFIEDVYDTLRGIRYPQSRVEGVENLFAPGGECVRLYGRMLEAYDHIRSRLGVVDEDQDVETIISSLMGMERLISYRMYEYGARFGMDRK